MGLVCLSFMASSVHADPGLRYAAGGVSDHEELSLGHRSEGRKLVANDSEHELYDPYIECLVSQSVAMMSRPYRHSGVIVLCVCLCVCLCVDQNGTLSAERSSSNTRAILKFADVGYRVATDDFEVVNVTLPM